MNKKKKTAYAYKCKVGSLERGSKNLIANGPVSMVAHLVKLGIDPREVVVYRKRRQSTDPWIAVDTADIVSCLQMVCGSIEKAEAEIAFHALAGTLDRENKGGGPPWWSTRNEFSRGAYIAYERDDA